MAAATAAAAKSLQSCPNLCNLIDGSPAGPPVPGTLQARTLEWVAISFSNAWKWKMKVKSLSRVRLSVIPWTAAYQAPPSPTQWRLPASCKKQTRETETIEGSFYLVPVVLYIVSFTVSDFFLVVLLFSLTSTPKKNLKCTLLSTCSFMVVTIAAMD